MRVLIIESTSKRKPLSSTFNDTSIVHCRNSIILKNELNADLLDGEYALEDTLKKQYDVIICMYASPYMPHIPYQKILMRNPNARYIWCVNDHDVEDNQLLRWGIINMGLSYDLICNNSRDGYRHWILGKNIAGKKLNDFINDWCTVNLNALIYRDSNIPITKKPNDIIYYGTYRKWRKIYFSKYLQSGVILSASKKNWKKFELDNCRATYINKLNWELNNEDLRQYKYSLYLEDIYTHDHYAFMANRFYEGLTCDTISLFASECKNSIIMSPYPISDSEILTDDKISNGVLNYINALDYNILLKKLPTYKDIARSERVLALNTIREFITK